MSLLHEVKIQPAKLDIIRDFDGLRAVMGQFAIEDYGCVLDTASIEATIPDTFFNPDFPEYTVTTLGVLDLLLREQYPSLSWSNLHSIPQPRNKKTDKGLHHDFDYDPGIPLFDPDELIVGYHVSMPCWGEQTPPDVEITFASPTDDFSTLKHSRRLAKLLREGKTDSSLIKPESVRSVRLKNGGVVAFTHKRPAARSQTHYFRTHSDGVGESYTRILYGSGR